VAEDLKRMLGQLGYKIVGTASNGEEAIKNIEATRPQLVLMDIRIQGPLDGIDVAEHIYAHFDIPVVYLTAYADETTVDRAKGTLASGYILKPFEERGLKTTIDLALYRHNMDRMLKQIEVWHGGILESLSAAVMAIDTKENVVYLNKTAETLTGKVIDQIFGKPLEDVFLFKNKAPGAVPTHLSIERDGRRITFDCKESIVEDLEGHVMGTAFILKETDPHLTSVHASH